MDWDDLRIFRAVAAAGSLSGAATNVGASQPTIGRRIARLEEELGLQLFHRHGRGLALTDAGRRLVDPIDGMDRLSTEVARLAKGEQREVVGSLRVSAPHALGLEWLIPRLPRLRSEHPALQIALITESETADLDRLSADVAIRFFRPAGPRLVARRAATFSNGLFASESYLAKVTVPRNLKQLRDHAWVAFNSNIDDLSQVQWLRSHIASPPAFTSNNLLAHREAIVAGLGLGLLPTYVAKGTPALRQLLARTSIPARTIWLTYHEDLRGNARVRAFVDFVVQELKADRRFFR